MVFESSNQNGSNSNLIQTFNRLTNEEKTDFLDLYDPGPGFKSLTELEIYFKNKFSSEDFKVARIFRVNAIGLGDDDTLRFESVYKNGSRLNHSCFPNVIWGGK